MVKRYHTETGSQSLTSIIASAQGLIVSRFTRVEVTAALVRRARHANEPVEKINGVLATLEADLRDSFNIVELDEPLLEQATSLARKHAIRGADAVQLACLLAARIDYGEMEVVLLSADDELNAAAIAEEFRVENPNLHQ